MQTLSRVGMRDAHKFTTSHVINYSHCEFNNYIMGAYIKQEPVPILNSSVLVNPTVSIGGQPHRAENQDGGELRHVAFNTVL